MLTTESILLIGSFALTTSLLTFGSRFIVDKFGLFPPDPSGDPTSFKNVLHHAWGRSSTGGLFSAQMAQKIANGDFGDLKDYLAPLSFAVVLGLGAIFSFSVFGKTKSMFSWGKSFKKSYFSRPFLQKSQFLIPTYGRSSHSSGRLRSRTTLQCTGSLLSMNL